VVLLSQFIIPELFLYEFLRLENSGEPKKSMASHGSPITVFSCYSCYAHPHGRMDHCQALINRESSASERLCFPGGDGKCRCFSMLNHGEKNNQKEHQSLDPNDIPNLITYFLDDISHY